jgi:hypothetical protein
MSQTCSATLQLRSFPHLTLTLSAPGAERGRCGGCPQELRTNRMCECRRPPGAEREMLRLTAHGASARRRSPVLENMLLSLDKTRPLRYITPMPPPTPLPVLTALIGLFRQGFWRRLAGRLFGRRATQQAEDPVEEFLLPILEAISRIAEAVQNGTYREPEYSPEPPDEVPETSGRKRPPKPPPQPPPIRAPEPEWLYGLIPARPRAPRPPPAPEPAERPSPTSRTPSPPAWQRPSWPPARSAARPPLPPPRVHIRSKKARPEPVRKHAHFVTITE